MGVSHFGLAVLVVAPTLFGCSSTVKSRHYDATRVKLDEDSTVPEGTLYYLPKRLVKLTFRPKGESSCDGDKHKICLFCIHSTDHPPDDVDLVTLELLPPMPDTCHAYTIALDPGLLRSDELSVSTTPEGLLTGVNFESKDETRSALRGIGRAAGIAGRLVAGAAVKGYTRAQRKKKGKAKPPASKFPECTFTFDPTCKESDGQGCKCYFPWGEFDKDYSDTTSFSLDCERLAPEYQKTGTPRDVDGVLYRRPVPYRITVKWEEVDSETTQVLTALVSIPEDIVRVPLTACGFTKSSSSLTLEEGMLTRLREERPSLELGFLSTLLIDLPSAILGIPGSLFGGVASEDNSRVASESGDERRPPPELLGNYFQSETFQLFRVNLSR